MLHGETVHSPLPQDIPWWSADFAIFFGVLYLVLFVIGSGVGYVLWRSWVESNRKEDSTCAHTSEPLHQSASPATAVE